MIQTNSLVQTKSWVDLLKTLALKSPTFFAVILNYLYHREYPLTSGNLLVNVTPVFKNDHSSKTKNYRPISLLCILSKILEGYVSNCCYSHNYFFPAISYEAKLTDTGLLWVYHGIIDALANRKETDVNYLDFTKAFASWCD